MGDLNLFAAPSSGEARLLMTTLDTSSEVFYLHQRHHISVAETGTI